VILGSACSLKRFPWEEASVGGASPEEGTTVNECQPCAEEDDYGAYSCDPKSIYCRLNMFADSRGTRHDEPGSRRNFL
jgi:hypothetical protein